MIELWRKISSLGVKDEMTISECKKVELSNQISILSVFLMSAIVVLIASFGVVPATAPHNSVVFLSALALLLNWKGHTKWSGFVLSIILPVATILLALGNKLYVTGDIPATAYLSPRYGLVGISIAPMILIDTRYKFMLLTAMFFQLLCMFLLDPIHDLLGVGFKGGTMSVMEYKLLTRVVFVPYIFITAATYFLLRITDKYEGRIKSLVRELKLKNNALHDQKEEIKQQNLSLSEAYKTIDIKNSSLTDSIRYARQIQKALFPKNEHLQTKFNDFFILNLPKDIVSGDFYWTGQSGDKVYVAVADCTGHGVPGAMMSMLGITSLNEIIHTGEIRSPGEILDQLRLRIKRELGQVTENSAGSKDGMDMALCAFDIEAKTMEYAGANNPVFVVNETLTVLDPTRNPISIFIKEVPFKTQSIQLQKGDWIYLFSDGYGDQFGGRLGFKFTTKKLKEEFLLHANKQGEEQKNCLHDRFIAWKKEQEQIDDVLIIGVQI